MSLHQSSMPGVLIDEGDADDSTSALFHATRIPTRFEVIRSAEWLGCTVEALCSNLELDFNSLPDGLTTEVTAQAESPATEPSALQTIEQPPMSRGDRITYWLVEALCIAAIAVSVFALASIIWQRWFA